MKRLISLAMMVGWTWGEGQAEFPPAPRLALEEELHGVSVPDPYRWLEEVDSAETRRWIEAQQELTEAYFADTPGRNWIRTRLEELWRYDKYGIPRERGGRLFYLRKTGLQNQNRLHWKDADSDADAKILVDPNRLSKDGTVALSGWSVSEDGRYLAYALSRGGSDWQEWKVREVETGRDLDDHLRWVKFSGAAWSKDGSGFYYSRYPAVEEGEKLEAVNQHHKVYFHRLGDPQEKDRLVYERRDEPKWNFGAFVSDDGRYLGLEVRKGAGGKNAFFYRHLEQSEEGFIELIDDFKSSWDFLGNDGARFYFQTDHEAPNSRIVAVDTTRQDLVWEDVIPEGPQPIEEASLLQDIVFVRRLVDVRSRVQRYDLEGRFLGQVEWPGIGSVWGFRGPRDAARTYYLVSGYTRPGTIYRYALDTGKSEVFAEPETAFDPGRYETRQVFFRSRDGTKIPLFLTGRKDAERDGENAVFLYGYGGFDISLTPYFSASIATWLEMGGFYAVANLRGGGEYGRDWHQAGTKERKQNVFDDFQAAAEFLIGESWTKPEKLAIGGGSNGGLLVGACLNQRPELYGAAVAHVGVFDMIRFPKFTIGWAWTDDFGDPESKKDFLSLLEYSPYHNTQTKMPYPATMIFTADHDDRVFPAHSFKFGAALQHAQAGEEPILLRIETKAGHGAGKPTSKALDEIVDQWSFLARELGMQIPPGR